GLIYLGHQIKVTENGVTLWYDNGEVYNEDPHWQTLPTATVKHKKRKTTLKKAKEFNAWVQATAITLVADDATGVGVIDDL
ncbi:hypothetical protein, partial [Salmonella enterica]|uniref:hypothetical protein n=1 Tax=Salmonella enterica TaxID=28901 RepID=UPI0020A57536